MQRRILPEMNYEAGLPFFPKKTNTIRLLRWNNTVKVDPISFSFTLHSSGA